MDTCNFLQDLLCIIQRNLTAIAEANGEVVKPGYTCPNLFLQQRADFLIEDVHRERIAHVVILDVGLYRVHVSCDDPWFLNPETKDEVLKSQPRRKEGWKAEAIVIAGHAAIHTPVFVCYDRAEVHEHVEIVKIMEVGIMLGLIAQIHMDKIECIDVVRARTKVCAILTTAWPEREPRFKRSALSPAKSFETFVSRSITLSMTNSPFS